MPKTSVFLALAASFTTPAMAELDNPFPIKAGDGVLTVDGGHSSLWMSDVNGDGLADLAVTDRKGLGLRLYPNSGSATEPKFGTRYLEIPLQLPAGSLLESHINLNTKASGWRGGTTIQLVDLNADDEPDLLGTTSAGITYWWKGLGQRKFDPPAPLNELFPDLKVRATISSMAGDMNGDGTLDFAFGSAAPYVHRGEGTQQTVLSLNPAKGETGPRPTSGAAIAITDWDGDEKPDIIFGTKFGTVGWIKNITEKDTRWRFDRCRFFVPDEKRDFESGLPGEPGGYARPFVFDWNGDGREDIITAITLETKEEAERDPRAHISQYSDARDEFYKASEEYESAKRTFLGAAGKQDPAKLHQWALARDADPKIKALWDRLQEAYEAYSPYSEQYPAKSTFMVYLRI